MRTIHAAISVANGSASLAHFGPFAKGDFLEGLLFHWYVNDALATLRVGLKNVRDASTVFPAQASAGAVLQPAIASGSGRQVWIPLMELIVGDDGLIWLAVYIDNTGGAVTVLGEMSLQARIAGRSGPG